VTDSSNNRIVRINDLTGAGWTTFGRKGSGANQFLNPIGIFVDVAGKIYVTDSWNNRIVRINDLTGAGWTTFRQEGQRGQPVRRPARHLRPCALKKRARKVTRTSVAHTWMLLQTAACVRVWRLGGAVEGVDLP